MRGKLAVRPLGRHQERITPADAGKTAACMVLIFAGEDHPRGCGENMFVRSRPQGELGSPPQVRGKQDNPPTVLPEAGITPAGAGKTSICAVRQADTEDHPRRCGENLTTFPQSSASAGSPPQVRGKHPPHFNASRRRRITPAGAGKTLYQRR